MPRTHILLEPRGRERASASEAATAAEAVWAAAAVAAEDAGARAAAAEAIAASKRSRRCRRRRPHRPRRCSRLRVAALLAHAPGREVMRLRSWRRRLKELLASRSTQKSLASSPHLPLQAPRDGCRVGVGEASGEGWDRLSTSPPPSDSPPLPPPQVSACGTPGRERESSFPRLETRENVRRAQQVPRDLEGEVGCRPKGPLLARTHALGPLGPRGPVGSPAAGSRPPPRGLLGSGSRELAADKRGACSRASGKLAHLQAL